MNASSVIRSTTRLASSRQCLRTSRGRHFSQSAVSLKVNQKLKPDGTPEPLHVPGSGIQHSSQIDQTHGGFMTTLASLATKVLGRKQIYYAAYQPSMDLYVQSAAQAAQADEKSQPLKNVSATKFWYNVSGLPPTFQTWFQITQLHLWMIMVRMRALPKSVGHHYQQQMTNHFFNDAEARLRVVYQIRDGRIIQTYMKDLLLQWRGSVAAYDQALVDGDAVMAAALWRNMYGARKDADLVCLDKMVGHVRANLKLLDGTSDEVMQSGKFDFDSSTLMK
ncbi:Putative uncharacterized protein [Taphrina deformans PYCC 5710]|uniref:Ubiquinol-cytochrome c chaperone domain-containing protein n=1 Tax=Taphrina deformans (strain PYCC 5710 / ATCC 11124 / CBS 356.35 / IMI 108563 / JCM 9778 / NBRC 8474) TaxID=1097556 RepID=R4XAN7_TAPDE|nr:Putative uncharacterized protein [Taphrina deformans PYCC 5710]|eukprot:CCG82863.1 Putative uncharacterized protein [Taphrina deformans PYCC 5710]